MPKIEKVADVEFTLCDPDGRQLKVKARVNAVWAEVQERCRRLAVTPAELDAVIAGEPKTLMGRALVSVGQAIEFEGPALSVGFAGGSAAALTGRDFRKSRKRRWRGGHGYGG